MYQNLNSKTSPSSETSHEISLVIGPTEVADVMTGKVVTLARITASMTLPIL